MIKVSIPLRAITVNQAWQGRRYSTPAKKAFERDVALLLPKKKVIAGPVSIHYKFYLKHHATSDYDNCIKVIQDCLVTKGYILDDRFIYHAVIEKIPAKEDKIVVEIKELKL